LQARRRIDNNLSTDLFLVLLYLVAITWGASNIFAAVYQPELEDYFSLKLNSTKQLLFIGVSFLVILVVMAVNYRTYEAYAYLFYVGGLLLLVSVLIFGREIAGSKSWFAIGIFRFQPSEFAKVTTALALAKFISDTNINLEKNLNHQVLAGVIALFPAFLILLQGDLGSAMVYSAFIFVLYREGLPNWILILVVSVVSLFVFTLFLPKIYLILTILSIALAAMLYTQLYLKKYQNALTYVLICTGAAIVFVFSVDYLVNKVLKPYQRQRIMVLINPEDSDKLSAGWNVSQSKIAIGSGGFWGKGFLAGTQTKLNFVPEQSTDFIFSTIGEEYGWMGSLATVGLFILILYRIIFVAERQRDRFVRIYAYGVASILFFHFAINIAMTIGLFPVVGIPLPFISYGGSSLIGFTVLLFILVKLDSHRAQMMERK